MKKYIEKRWVSTSETPSVPLGKSYRPQESRVIEFISSGHLNRIRQATDIGIGNRPVSEWAPLELLKKSQRETKPHETNHYNTTVMRDVAQVDRQDFLEDLHLPSKATMTSPSTVDAQNSVASSSSITVPVALDSVTEAFCSATSELEKEMGIDDYLPKSFKYDLMTPCALSVDSTSSISRTICLQSEEDSSSLYSEDLMKIVCDVGIQTDWVVLDDAGC